MYSFLLIKASPYCFFFSMVILFVSQGPSLKMPWHSWKIFMMILILICLFCLLRNRTVPDLPPKNYFGRFSKEVVDARQQGLQDFLLEWVVNKRDKNSFCRQHFCLNQRLLFILQKQCLRYSNVVCIHMLDLLMKKCLNARSFVQCPVLIHLAPILQRLNSAIHPRNCFPVDKYSLLKTNCALSSSSFLASQRD